MFSFKRIYADAAAATPLSPRARKELVRLLDWYGNAGAIHTEGIEAKKELEEARARIAKSIHAHPDEIVFTSSGTEANNLALHGTLRLLLREYAELHAITLAIEHQSVLEPLRALEREGLYVTEMGVLSDGRVEPKAVTDLVNEETALISIQLVNSEVGTIEPVREIVKEVRRIRAVRAEQKNPIPLYVHTDASQAPLWLSIDVEKLGVDFLTLDAQKVLGPKGVGALYIRRGTPVEPILWGGSQEMGLRGGTPNVPLVGSFGVALEDAQRGVEERAKKVATVRDFLWSEIQRLFPDAILNGPDCTSGVRVANSVNVSIPGLDAQMGVVSLNALGIAASTRSACTAVETEPSHVIEALGVPKELAGTAIRLTLLPDITVAQAKRIAKALLETAQRYRTQ
jgi:cysteine desulfurase